MPIYFLWIRPDTLLAAEGFEAVFCILQCWMWDTVPICSLYASVLVMGRCADLVPVCFGIGCGTLCRSGSCMLGCWLWDVVPIWFLYASVLVVERCADFFLYIVFFLALGRMYIRFYSLFSAVEFPAGDVAAVWAAAEEV